MQTKKFTTNRRLFCATVILPMLFAARHVLGATSCSLPNTFQNGTPANADQVNANFTALQNCVNDSTRIDDKGNTASGWSALLSNTTGYLNTAIGYFALISNTTGYQNTVIGSHALQSNTTGPYNTATGGSALYSNTTGVGNTGNGMNTLQSNTTGNYNTALGKDALLSNTTGSYNVASGYGALQSSTISSANTAYGAGALGSLTDGIFNIGVGNGAGINLTSGTHNIYIDNQGQTTESGTIRIGDAHYNQAFIGGIANTPLNGSEVVITPDGQVGILASSARFKQDITPMGKRSRGLFSLRPVTFFYKKDAQRQLQYGLIAEEVEKVYPELVVRRADGQVESVQYHKLIPMLLNEVQHQHQALNTQAREIAVLKAQNDQLQAALAQQNEAILARLTKVEAAHAATLVSR